MVSFGDTLSTFTPVFTYSLQSQEDQHPGIQASLAVPAARMPSRRLHAPLDSCIRGLDIFNISFKSLTVLHVGRGGCPS